MENVREWVAQKMELLDPPSAWHPDAREALRRFRQDIAMDSPLPVWRRWQTWATAAVLMFGAFLVLPAGRAVAYDVWQFLTVRRVAFIRVNAWPEGVRSPKVGPLNDPLPPIPARNVDDARWRVHYDPRLPRPGILSGSPHLATMFSLSAGTVVHVTDLQLALTKAGIVDQIVPQGWEGAQVALHTSAIVVAQWPDVILAQSLPLTLTTPSSFDFPAFSAIILRILGVAPDEAQRLAQRAGIAPPWLAPIGRDLRAKATIEEVELHSGPATMLEETGGNDAITRITLVWSVPDRVYLLSGNLSRQLMIATADAVE